MTLLDDGPSGLPTSAQRTEVAANVEDKLLLEGDVTGTVGFASDYSGIHLGLF